jgi:hypothetical protein
MNHLHLFFGLFVATPLVFGAPASTTSTESPARLQPVTVSATKNAETLRFDVRTACPDIDVALQKSLSSAWGRVREPGSMRVQFRLEGTRITDVRSSGASWDYRPYVRRAVTKLDCGVGSTDAQEFAFLLVIRNSEESSSQARVALLER